MASIPVRVALRCRPFVSQEKCDGCQPCLHFVPGEPQVILKSKKQFTFDHTFNEEIQQEEVFNKCVLPMIENVFKGYNVTIMAYGQTGSGKTYTMGTLFSPTISDDPDKIGIIPRAIKAIFDGMGQRKTTNFQVKASFLEIYKEELNDLLKCSKSANHEIVIRDDSTGVKVYGISELTVNNCNEVLQCLERGSLLRTTGTTAMNSHSSRSHAIFTLSIETKNLENEETFVSKFHFVDLAGSERAKKTKAEGERFKEGVNINLGLLALGNVICALCEGSARNHVPYRESKLTRLLQDSLGGSSHTVMIACVGPADYNIEETLNTLRYAHRARKIKNKPVVNQNPQAMEIARLRLLVQQLQGQLVSNVSHGNEQNSPVVSSDELESARMRIIYLESENQHLGRELQSAIDQTTELYEKAFIAETARDKVKQKLEELKQKANFTIDSFNESLEVNENPKIKEHLELMRELQKSLAEVQETAVKIEAQNYTGIANINDTTFNVPSLVLPNETYNEANDVANANRQVEMNRQLQALNRALAMKEELAAKLVDNGGQFGSLKEQYERNMKDLEKEVADLQHEKEELSQALRMAQTNSNNKISEQRRKRLIELETKLSEQKKKLTEFQRLAAMKTQSDKEIEKLNKEIAQIKHNRVQLVRQMKQESEQMRKYKLDKEREVNYLKQQEQKRRMELVKKQQQFDKEQNVSKRRIEQVAAVNKRLKEALLKQKSVCEKRDKDKEKAGYEKVRSLIDHEIELAMSVWEARYHLDALVKERRDIAEELKNFRNDISDSSSESSSNESSLMSPSKKMSKVNQLEMDLEMRQIQIDEIQQKLLDFDQEERKKLRWVGIQMMSEAKSGLNYLFNLLATNRQELFCAQNSNEDLLRLESTYKQTIKEFKKEISELKFTHDEQMVKTRKQYEDQIYLLMTSRSTSALTSDDTVSATSTSMVTAPEDCNRDEVFAKPRSKVEKTALKRLYKNKRPAYPISSWELTSDDADHSDEETSRKEDPDWKHTPLMRRIQQMKERTFETKLAINELDDDDEDDTFEEVENIKPVRAKKRKSDDKGCGCRTACNQKRCKCFKSERSCDSSCHCTDLCRNKALCTIEQNKSHTLSVLNTNS